jgi:hypothetical protein
MRSRLLTAAVMGMALVSMAGRLDAQVELDRIVGRVGDRIITESDLRQARTLGLVDDVSSDDATRLAVENRLLILSEISRSAPLAPATAADLAARRRGWEAGLGGPARAAELLRQSGMSESALDAWLRDDVMIRAYLARQFGRLPAADRDRATADWLSRLRLRADLR